MNQGRAARACGGWSRRKLEGGAASTGSPEDVSYRPAVAPAPRIVGPQAQLGESSRGRLGTHSVSLAPAGRALLASSAPEPGSRLQQGCRTPGLWDLGLSLPQSAHL